MKLREINKTNLKENMEIKKRKPLTNNSYFMVTIENSILNWAPKNYLGNNKKGVKLNNTFFERDRPLEHN